MKQEKKEKERTVVTQKRPWWSQLEDEVVMLSVWEEKILSTMTFLSAGGVNNSFFGEDLIARWSNYSRAVVGEALKKLYSKDLVEFEVDSIYPGDYNWRKKS